MGLEPMIEALQAPPLPLGYRAQTCSSIPPGKCPEILLAPRDRSAPTPIGLPLKAKPLDRAYSGERLVH